ncbi:MAG: radical SAM protein [Clostridia bacterium]|nr:radical SAM protein [Clostridia bacterium]
MTIFKNVELSENTEFRLESLEVGLTSKCNFKCEYCCAYMKDDSEVLRGDRVIDIIKELKYLNRVKLSGGEVLMYFDDCLKVVDFCTSREIHSQINSNGSLLNKEKIYELKNAGLKTLHISLNFTNAKDFSRFYKVDETVFDRIIDNIKTSVQSGLDTVVETIIFSETENNMKEVCNFVYDLGVRKMEIQYGVPTIHSGWNKITFEDKLSEVIEGIIKNKKDDTQMFFSCIDITHYHEFNSRIDELNQKGVYFPKCIEGKKQLHLHSNGDVLICELGYPVVIGNIFSGTSLDGIFKSMPEELIRFLNDHNCQKNCVYQKKSEVTV